MNSDEPIRKRGTSRLVVGLAQGSDRGISARIETSDGDVIILRDETLSALVQAYMDVFTHPTMNAIELLAAPAPSNSDKAELCHLLPGNTAEELLRLQLSPASQTNARDHITAQRVVRTLAEKTDKDLKQDSEGSSGGLKTQAMDQIDNQKLAGHAGWQTRDDGPVFGDVPTHHSAPSHQTSKNDDLD
jgi:hypothetical protein